MGRAYKALVRADRWKDADRPIGTPIRPEGETEQRRKSASASLSNAPAGAATAPLWIEHDISPTEESTLTPSVQQFMAAGRAHRAAGAAVAAIASSAKPKSTALNEFEEPDQILDIRELSLDPRLVAFNSKDRFAQEQYQNLAAKLLGLANRRNLKTLLITSAEAGEGKT